MLLSICIPTFNRARHLRNCLNSIISAGKLGNHQVEICISDNNSSDETVEIVNWAKQQISIKYQKNERNIGVARNVLSVVSMASGDFVWLLGDDDLVMPDAISTLVALLEQHSESVDFFYINANHLTTEYVLSYPQPFDLSNLPARMSPFSEWRRDGIYHFMDLVNPKVSFDFLGGMFLSVFRRTKWLGALPVLDQNALNSERTFSHFDNTFVHVKIFATAFARSNAFFHSRPLSICLTGAREWAPMYPLVRSVRLIEALGEYRKNGLTLFRYLLYRNFALAYFIPDLVYMMRHRAISGIQYIKPFSLILRNLFSPNMYFSFVYYIFRKIGQKICKEKR